MSHSVSHEVMGPDDRIFIFLMLSFKPASHSPLSRSLPGSSAPLHCHKRCVICISEVIDTSPGNLDSSFCASSSLAFRMMYSEQKLNKQGDNIRPWRTPFPIWNQSIIPCQVLTAPSRPTYRFRRRQIRWSGNPISSRIFYSLLWSTSQSL